MASFHGRATEFSGATDDWDSFTEQLSHYLTVSGITDTDKKRVVVLLNDGRSVERHIDHVRHRVGRKSTNHSILQLASI